MPDFGSLTAPRILFVEDDEDLRTSVEELLCSVGFQLKAVADADDAMSALASEPFGVLLSDVNLRGESGLSLAKRARELNPALPIILASGFGELVREEARRELGNIVVMKKPYSLSDITAAVRSSCTEAPTHAGTPGRP